MAQLLSVQKLNALAGDGITPWTIEEKTKEGINGQWPSSTVNMSYDVGKDVNMDGVQKRSSTDFRRYSIPVTVKWKNISVTTKAGKHILKNVTGTVNTGELTAIMGPSGAGKTTLLNVLSGFTRQKLSGQILVNGSNRDMKTFRKLSSYIMQDDHLLPHLTVWESIYMAACLKISSKVSKQERNRVVEECMQSLGLFECRNTRANQLSGGERKRLCIAQELVSNPPLIFLDEPTSGLDSSSCLQCIQLLKSLAEEGRTIVCTIHQPSARIFEIFDKLYMLAEGQCIYKGSIRNLIPSLAEQGLTCPQYHNPADFVTEVATGEHGDWILGLKKVVNCMEEREDESLLDEASVPSRTSISEGPFNENSRQFSTVCLIPEKVEKGSSVLTEDIESNYCGYVASAFNQFKVLTYRSLVCTFRDPMTMQLRFIAHLAIGLLLGTLYFDIGNDASKIFNNAGFLFFSLLFINFGGLMPTVLTFPLEKTIFIREHLNSCYSTKMYFLAKTAAEIPFSILFPLAYCCIVYWMTSQPNDMVRFGIFILSATVTSAVAQSVGLLIGAATSVQNAVFLAPLTSIPILLFGGFFVNLKYMPWYLKWLSYISYMRYSYQSVLLGTYSMNRPDLICNKTFCPFQNPQDFIEEMDLAEGSQYVDYAALSAFLVIVKIATYIFLKYKVARRL